MLTTIPAHVVHRFWSSVVKSEGCWEWQGAKSKGYGVLVYSLLGVRQRWKCHHFAVVLDGRTITPGMVVMHLCDNRACVRPDHLRVGTQSENIKDMWDKQRRVSENSSKTHCRHGHRFDGENLRMYAKERVCRACKRASALARYHRTKQLKGE